MHIERCILLLAKYGLLAITPTSLALEARLAQQKEAACGTSSCGCT